MFKRVLQFLKANPLLKWALILLTPLILSGLISSPMAMLNGALVLSGLVGVGMLATWGSRAWEARCLKRDHDEMAAILSSRPTNLNPPSSGTGAR